MSAPAPLPSSQPMAVGGSGEVRPTVFGHLQLGLRLVEDATGTAWTIERLSHLNRYTQIWVHLVGDGPDPPRRRIDCGHLLSARDGGQDWHVAPAPG